MLQSVYYYCWRCMSHWLPAPPGVAGRWDALVHGCSDTPRAAEILLPAKLVGYGTDWMSTCVCGVVSAPRFAFASGPLMLLPPSAAITA